MPLYKRKPFSLVEKPKDLKPQELVFQWVRHLEDGSFNHIDGAKQPEYRVTADDVNAYLAIKVQPPDDRKRKQVLDKNQRPKMLENLCYLENPVLLELCGTLFSEDNGSFWSGPHSLVECRSSTRKSSIHDAIATFMM